MSASPPPPPPPPPPLPPPPPPPPLPQPPLPPPRPGPPPPLPPAVAGPDVCQNQSQYTLHNGDFEIPNLNQTVGLCGLGSPGEWTTLLDFSSAGTPLFVPNWLTTAPDHLIEFWATSCIGCGAPSSRCGGPAVSGNQYVELNANYESTLFQDISTIPGLTLYFSLSHRGRTGADTMQVVIGPPSGGAAELLPVSSRSGIV